MLRICFNYLEDHYLEPSLWAFHLYVHCEENQMKYSRLLNCLWITGISTALVAQAAHAQVAQITGVQVNPTTGGLEILLETTAGASTLVQSSRTDDRFVAEISNAQLALPEGNTFRQENPTEQIQSISITPLDQNRVQVEVVGENAAPTGNIFLRGGQGLVVQLMPSVPTAETPPAPVAEDELDPIELVVTATRTEEAVEDVPRSVTVITREQLEEQTTLTRDLGEILGELVPGFGPPDGRAPNNSSLRGREAAVLIDGVPQNANFSFERELQTIDPSAIERIEVVRGPSAIYGGEATGGVINIITRRPAEDEFTATTRAGLNLSLTHPSNSLGGSIQQFVSGRQDNFDYTLSASYDRTGASYDAEGDRIPTVQGIDESQSLNLLGKFGYDIDDQQRLQLTVNHFRTERNTDVISDPIVDEIEGRQKARALKVGDIEYIGAQPQGDINTVLNLDYSYQDLIGSSDLTSQFYYRDNEARTDARDRRSNRFFQSIFQATLDSTNLGGRLQLETPLFEERVQLLTGVDYNRERTSAPYNLFDPETFDETSGRVNRKIEERFLVPPYELSNLGIFALAEWDVTDQVQLSGGVRHERIGFSADDFTTFDGIPIAGGERDFSDTVFNAGALYQATDNISLFANFAQGFSVPDLGIVLGFAEPGFTISEDLQITQPQKVNQYEVGVRGNWPTVQASLAGFYNTSDLGSTFVLDEETNLLDLVRAPERIYGVEATVDWQPAKRWQVGSTVSWVEGEADIDDTGEFLPLSLARIQPLKLTAYVENETLPGWRNRLQALYVGSRARSFEEGIDPSPVNDYFVVDFISSVKAGPGTLEIGVENLFNNLYFPAYAQQSGGFTDTFYSAAPGITLRLGYSLTW